MGKTDDYTELKINIPIPFHGYIWKSNKEGVKQPKDFDYISEVIIKSMMCVGDTSGKKIISNEYFGDKPTICIDEDIVDNDGEVGFRENVSYTFRQSCKHPVDGKMRELLSSIANAYPQTNPSVILHDQICGTMNAAGQIDIMSSSGITNSATLVITYRVYDLDDEEDNDDDY